MTPTKNESLPELLARALPFLRDEAAKYTDDGNNEPLELARSIEAELAGRRNRDAREPGGMQCEKCGSVFVGAEWHVLCGMCIDHGVAQPDGSGLRDGDNMPASMPEASPQPQATNPAYTASIAVIAADMIENLRNGDDAYYTPEKMDAAVKSLRDLAALTREAPTEGVLDRPARVAGRDFAAGQSTRQVIGRAQAHYEVHHEGCLRHPHTGELRDYRDVESDPDGTLCVGPGPLEAATPPAPQRLAQGEEGWARMTQEARAIQMRHVNKHDGDVYHAMQSLVIKHGFRSDAPLTQPITTQPPHQDREEDSRLLPDWFMFIDDALRDTMSRHKIDPLDSDMVLIANALEDAQRWARERAEAALTEAKRHDPEGGQSRALMLAADQLARLALECPHGSRIRYEACEWANIAHYAARAEAKQQGRTEPEVCPQCFWVNPKQQGPGEAVTLTAEEREWLDYAADHMADDSEPEDKTCERVLRALLERSEAAPQVEAKRQTDIDWPSTIVARVKEIPRLSQCGVFTLDHDEYEWLREQVIAAAAKPSGEDVP